MPDEEYWKEFKRKTLANIRREYPQKTESERRKILYGILRNAGWRPQREGGPTRG